MSHEIVIETEGLTKHYKRGRSEIVRALEDVSLRIHAAEFVLIFGPSGSGKSTLLNLLSGLDTPTSGTIKFLGEDVTGLGEIELTQLRSEHVGFIFQDWKLIDNLTAVENVEVPLYPTDIPSNELRTNAISILRQLDLLDRENHFPAQLSGGEQQRVSIARALIKSPKVIFADEPTGNLDQDTGNLIMRMLKRVCRRGTTVLVSTHNERLKEYADKIIYLENGKLLSRRGGG